MRFSSPDEQAFVFASLLVSCLDKHLLKSKEVLSILHDIRKAGLHFSENKRFSEYIRSYYGDVIEEKLLNYLIFAELQEEDFAIHRKSFASGQYCTLLGDESYPRLLAEIPAAPVVLFMKGEIFRRIYDYQNACITLIGTRKPSDYGLRIARLLGGEIAKNKGVVVSGLAYGIDSSAQEAAVKAGGQSISVLASSLDDVYPKNHRSLFAEICKEGGAISEHPSGSVLYRQYFPARNRIMSGLSRTTVVIESSQRSGTLITVEQALAQGRDVWAVPGDIFSPQSKGVNALIAAGANVLHEPDLFLTEMQAQGVLRKGLNDQKRITELNTKEDLSEKKLELLKYIATCLSKKSYSAEALAEQEMLAVSEVYWALTRLDELGLLSFSGGEYLLTGQV